MFVALIYMKILANIFQRRFIECRRCFTRIILRYHAGNCFIEIEIIRTHDALKPHQLNWSGKRKKKTKERKTHDDVDEDDYCSFPICVCVCSVGTWRYERFVFFKSHMTWRHSDTQLDARKWKQRSIYLYSQRDKTNWMIMLLFVGLSSNRSVDLRRAFSYISIEWGETREREREGWRSWGFSSHMKQMSQSNDNTHVP